MATLQHFPLVHPKATCVAADASVGDATERSGGVILPLWNTWYSAGDNIQTRSSRCTIVIQFNMKT